MAGRMFNRTTRPPSGYDRNERRGPQELNKMVEHRPQMSNANVV